MSRKVGITTTVPVEVLLAAGCEPVDLNNLFVSSDRSAHYIQVAEREGFPKSSCAWIKGIYGACLENDIGEIVGVTGGDCSNTIALLEVLRSRGLSVFPFAYPHVPNKGNLKIQIDEFISVLDTTQSDVLEVYESLKPLREKVEMIDKASYERFVVSGFENHLYQVSCSDFFGSIDTFEESLDAFLATISSRGILKKSLRLAYMGVPPMTSDIYDFVESHDALIVYNEVQREFAMPFEKGAKTIYDQYVQYTYPYGIEYRLAEIQRQITKRKIDAVIHYTQSFCYRAIEDILVKQRLNVPVFTLEGDKNKELDSRTKLRLEAFLDMLQDKKKGFNPLNFMNNESFGN